jgi:hypothetical protein
MDAEEEIQHRVKNDAARGLDVAAIIATLRNRISLRMMYASLDLREAADHDGRGALYSCRPIAD